MPGNIKIIGRAPDGSLGYVQGGAVVPPSDIADGGICHITLDVRVKMGGRTDDYTGLELGKAHPRAIDQVLHPETPTDELSLVWFEREPGIDGRRRLGGACQGQGCSVAAQRGRRR